MLRQRTSRVFQIAMTTLVFIGGNDTFSIYGMKLWVMSCRFSDRRQRTRAACCPKLTVMSCGWLCCCGSSRTRRCISVGCSWAEAVGQSRFQGCRSAGDVAGRTDGRHWLFISHL
ncbi:hypothetical protein GDO78_022148 [Eleutherodactylus coqui]|uniref:Uncharacterized protein n=1 Tax=Eleutherodactylus coqui TaxID=57060 RepID=A0A8J6EC73_ELECQ|nr:hypothetical protein GDO78_022148 [Eleutherodactylus coqui]